MILGGKLPGKVGRCRFFLTKNRLRQKGLFFFLQNGSVSPFRKVWFPTDYIDCGVAAKSETMKLARLTLARYMDVAAVFLPTDFFHRLFPQTFLCGFIIKML